MDLVGFVVAGQHMHDQVHPETVGNLAGSREETAALRDKAWLDGYEQWFAKQAGVDSPVPVPPMFTPYTVRGVTLKNRVVVSPMAQYSAVDGVAGDYHLVHLGARAMGGAGLVFAEMSCVSAEGRITPGCPGLYKPEHTTAFKRIADWIHTHTDAKFGIQIGHAGRKASTAPTPNPPPSDRNPRADQIMTIRFDMPRPLQAPFHPPPIPPAYRELR